MEQQMLESICRSARARIKQSVAKGIIAQRNEEDIYQDVVYAAWLRRGEYNKSLTSIRTFAERIVCWELQRVLESKKQKQISFEESMLRYSDISDKSESEDDLFSDSPASNNHESRFGTIDPSYRRIEIKHDIEVIIKQCTEDNVLIIEQLFEDNKISTIAAKLGISRQEVYRQKDIIREIFIENGFDNNF